MHRTSQDLSQLSESALSHLSEMVDDYPDNHLYQDDQLGCTVLKFNENTFVALGKHIGQGFWGQVELATIYQKQPDPDSDLHGKKCVIKSSDKSNLLKNILHTLVNTPGLMGNESELIKKVYGLSECLTTPIASDPTDTQTYILQPYLGDLSLAKLLQQTEKASSIACQQWLTFFIKLIKKLDKFHNKTKCLHNDIKPDNIGLSLSEESGELAFTQINFFDLGNAHSINGTGSFGDPRYQPLESYLGVALPSIKNEKIDIYALGITLLETIECLLIHALYEEDKRSYMACKKVFQQMSAINPAYRPSLKACLEELLPLRNARCSPIAQFEVEESNDAAPVSLLSGSPTQTFFQSFWDYSSTQIQSGTQQLFKLFQPGEEHQELSRNENNITQRL